MDRVETKANYNLRNFEHRILQSFRVKQRRTGRLLMSFFESAYPFVSGLRKEMNQLTRGIKP